MQALKEICIQYRKWKPLEDYILRIETYKDNNGSLVIENSKALIEGICKTILDDLGEAYSASESIQGLVSKACNKMSCLPNTGDLARSFFTVAQRLGEFRNAFVSVGHGQSVYKLEENKSKAVGASINFMINSIEQLAIFLITVYQDEYPRYVKSQLRYEDNSEFNTDFDEQIEIIEIGQYGPYSPSEVLFYVDKSAYRTELENFNQK